MKVYVHLLLCVSVTAEVITLIRDRSVKCVITEESVYSAIEVVPWVEFKRQKEIIDGWDSTLEETWEHCDGTECAKDFDMVIDQRWEGFDTPCTNQRRHEGAVKLKEYRQFLSLYSDSGTSFNILLKNQNHDVLNNFNTPKSLVSQWGHYSLRTTGNYFEIHGDTISTSLSLDSRAEWIVFSSQDGTMCRKLHKYEFMYSNSPGESNITISNNSFNCVSMYVSVDENCFLEVRFEKDDNTTSKTVEGFNQDKTFRKWRPFHITNNSDGPGILYLHKGKGRNKAECFWAVAEIQKCRNRIEFYNVSLGNGTKRDKQHICRTLKRDNNTESALSINQHFDVSNKVFNCSEVLGNSYPHCEEHKICLEDGTCFCSWGYKGTYCNETCQGRCNPANSCPRCKKNLDVVQAQNGNLLYASNSDKSTISEFSSDSPKSQNENFSTPTKQATTTQRMITTTRKFQETTRTTHETLSTVKKDGSFDNTGTNKEPKNYVLIIIAVSVTAFLVLIIIIFIYYKQKKHRRSRSELVNENEAMLQVQNIDNKCHDVIELQCANSIFRNLFSRDMSIRITNNFDKQVGNFLNDLEVLETLVNYLNEITVKSDSICILSEDEKTKNRVRTILPGQSQVTLPSSLATSSTYINAITVDCYNHPKKFIVTQQPLPNTVEDFWILVRGYEIDTIVSLNHEHDPHCPRFWPSSTDQQLLISKSCHISYHNNIDKYLYNNTKVVINNQKEVNVIRVKKWDRESTTPESVIVLLKIWDEIRNNPGQIVVTCYDGATASGLFVALAFLLEKIFKERVCDVFTAVKTVRKNRFQFVQYSEQLTFLFEAALTYVQNSTED